MSVLHFFYVALFQSYGHETYRAADNPEERRKVLIIGFREEEVGRLFPPAEGGTIDENLREQDLFIMDPQNENTTMHTPLVPHLHIVQGHIPREEEPLPVYSMFVPHMFDTIIVDFSTLKSMSSDKLAEFGALYLKQKAAYHELDGMFVRDLATSGYEYTPVDIRNYQASGRTVTILWGRESSIRVYLQPQWTTTEYLTFIGMAGMNLTAMYIGQSIEADIPWSTVVRDTDRDLRISLASHLGSQSLHALIAAFVRHNLICVPIEQYPLRHLAGSDRDLHRDLKVRCRFVLNT